LGALLCTAGLSIATYGVTGAQTHGWSDRVTVGSLVAGCLLLVAFVLWERWVPEPTVDVELFVSRQFSQSTLALVLSYFALLGFLFLFTPYLQVVRGHTSLETGLRMLPLVGAMIVGALMSDVIYPRTGPRVPVFTGMALISAGILLFSRVGVQSGDNSIAAYTAVIGAGVGLTLAAGVHAAMETLPDANSGMGAGLTSALRQVGGAFGVAVLGTLLGTGYRDQLEPALQGLPVAAANSAQEEIGAALSVAQQVGGPRGEALATAARQAYIDNMHGALVVAAVVAFIGAVSVLFAMPGRPAGEPAVPPASPAASQAEPVL
jgi:Na+/melibiose symporter-like transporter